MSDKKLALEALQGIMQDITKMAYKKKDPDRELKAAKDPIKDPSGSQNEDDDE